MPAPSRRNGTFPVCVKRQRGKWSPAKVKFRDAAKNSISQLNEVVFVLIGSGGQIWEISAVAKPRIPLSFRGELAGVYLLK
jgi:hypothetical protein